MIAALVFSASAAYAQWFDFSNNNGRFEAGLCIGQVGTGTPYEGVGIGASVSAFGYLSIQPVKWFSISFVYTRMAIYGSIVLNLTAFADR